MKKAERGQNPSTKPALLVKWHNNNFVNCDRVFDSPARLKVCKSCYCLQMTWKDKDYQARYHREVWYPKNKARRYELNKANVQKNQRIIGQIKLDRGCKDCGYNKHVEALDFDHLGEKKLQIATAIRNGISMKRLLAEIETCEVVCANCHRIRTANRRGSIK